MGKHLQNWKKNIGVGQTGKNTGQIFKTLDQGQMVTEAPINILKLNKVPVSNMKEIKKTGES